MLTFFVTLLDLPFFCWKIDLSLLLHAMISLARSGERLGQQQSGVMYILFGEPLLLMFVMKWERGRKEVGYPAPVVNCGGGGEVLLQLF